MNSVLLLLAVIVALPGVIGGLHLIVLGAASVLFPLRAPTRGSAGRQPDPVRFLVLIPAHNEEKLIRQTLTSVNDSLRPRDRVLVVADRCTDRTAQIARSLGAQVLERVPGDTPGRAAARQAGIEAGREWDWDAVVMLDADSVVSGGFFDACEAALAGVEAVQARTELEPGRGLAGRLSLVAFAVQGVLLPRGRAALGLAVRLRGTGMVVRRHLLDRHQFRAAAGEDRWYGLDLLLDGVIPTHLDTARVVAANVTNWRDASEQRVRYEAGRVAGAHNYIRRLLAARTLPALEAAWELASPPTAMTVLSLGSGLILALAGQSPALALSFACLIALEALAVVGALLQAKAEGKTWLALVAAPYFVLWKLPIQLRAFASVKRRQAYFPPTPR